MRHIPIIKSYHFRANDYFLLRFLCEEISSLTDWRISVPSSHKKFDHYLAEHFFAENAQNCQSFTHVIVLSDNKYSKASGHLNDMINHFRSCYQWIWAPFGLQASKRRSDKKVFFRLIATCLITTSNRIDCLLYKLEAHRLASYIPSLLPAECKKHVNMTGHVFFYVLCYYLTVKRGSPPLHSAFGSGQDRSSRRAGIRTRN